MHNSRQQTQSYQSRIVEELESMPECKLKIPWTRFETEVLKRFYGKRRTSDIAKKIGRTVEAVRVKASVLGLNFSKEE